MPVAPTVKGITDDADGQTWVEVIKGNTAEDYKMYLDSFPQGRYAKSAAKQKKKFEDYARAKTKADAAQAELSSWNTAIQSDTEAAYNAYLMQYPNGPHAVLAKIKGKNASEVAIAAAIEKIAPSVAANMVAIPGKNYELAKYEVTQVEWRAMMGSNPSKFTSCGSNCPVEDMSWNDMQKFITRLNAWTGKHYRLPTDAEWEYACYGGNQTEYCGSNNIELVAWYDGNSSYTTHAVGKKQSNGYGLYDMSGNVFEWTQDKGDSESWHLIRGGSWNSQSEFARAARRGGMGNATDTSSVMGFRLARTLP